MSEDFPPEGFTGVTGVEEYINQQRMNKIVQSVCDTARDRCELNKGGVLVKNASYWKRQADQLRTENAEAKMIIRWVLDWVDAVPSDTQLPTMPGFDRDYVENFLSGEVDDEP